MQLAAPDSFSLVHSQLPEQSDGNCRNEAEDEAEEDWEEDEAEEAWEECRHNGEQCWEECECECKDCWVEEEDY